MSNNRKIEVQEKEDFTYSNLTPMPNDVVIEWRKV